MERISSWLIEGTCCRLQMRFRRFHVWFGVIVENFQSTRINDLCWVDRFKRDKINILFTHSMRKKIQIFIAKIAHHKNHCHCRSKILSSIFNQEIMKKSNRKILPNKAYSIRFCLVFIQFLPLNVECKINCHKLFKIIVEWIHPSIQYSLWPLTAIFVKKCQIQSTHT